MNKWEQKGNYSGNAENSPLIIEIYSTKFIVHINILTAVKDLTSHKTVYLNLYTQFPTETLKHL